MPQPADAPTIYTVAQHAGVSVATVSRVLQGSTAASASARERVTRAVEELGYQPLRPRNRRPQTLGLVVPSLTGPESAALLLGMQAPDPAAGQARMLLACEGIGDAIDVDEAVTRFAAQTDGLVICDATASDDVVAALAEQQPVVVLGRPAIRGCDVLDVDQQAPITELVAGLVALGRRRMVFVGDPAANRALASRYAGFRAALAEQGLDEHAVPIAVAADASGADEALPRLLAARPGLDVAVCASDDLALRLMHVLVWRNVRVPDDLAITGWGDEPGASYVVPRLTTVSDPSRDLGRRAVDALRRRIADRGAPPIGYVSVPQVVWRESTGRP